MEMNTVRVEMSSDSICEGSASFENVSCGEVEAESNNIDSLEVVSSGRETMHLESAAENLTRVELDIARSSEKLINLYILATYVASREHDFEVFFLEEDHALEGPVVKALEFYLLHMFLDSEVSELESFLLSLQTEILVSQEVVSSFKYLGDTIDDMEDKLRDCENSLKQSFKQVSDIKMQSANSQRILLASSGEVSKEVGCLENNNSPNLSTEIQMQTAEQKRSIWRMLEKSLARELYLEKKLTESRETEEELKLRLQGEAFSMEQEAENMCERLFEAENSAEILFGVSKELFAQIQMAQFSRNGLTKREGELRSKLEDITEQNKELIKKASEAEKRAEIAEVECKKLRLREETFSMELEIDNMCERLYEAENSAEIFFGVSKELFAQIQTAQFSRNELIQREGELRSKLENFIEQNKELVKKASEAEKRAEIADVECKKLRESNMEINANVSRLKSNITDATNQVEKLERQLKDSEIKRLHAVASAEASQEKQSMLDCTIKDMENLIKDLKSKVQRANSQTESAEDKCIILSESNADLVEEINFLRHRMELFESSLHHADEAKKETAKNISVQAKLITDLVLQLALERERLHKQILSLTKEKKIAVKFLKRLKDPSVTVIGSPDAKVEEVKISNSESKNDCPGKEFNEEITGSSITSCKMGNAHRDSSETGTNTGHDDPSTGLDTVSETGTNTGHDDPSTELDTVTNIDARQLKPNYVFLIVIVLVIPALASFMFSAASY